LDSLLKLLVGLLELSTKPFAELIVVEVLSTKCEEDASGIFVLTPTNEKLFYPGSREVS